MWPDVLASLALPPGLAFAMVTLVRRMGGSSLTGSFRQDAYAGWAFFAAELLVFVDVPFGLWPAAACSGANAIVGAWLYWRNRHPRERAPRAYGLKSRALVAALVAKAREAAKPRPALKPAPGGAR